MSLKPTGVHLAGWESNGIFLGEVEADGWNGLTLGCPHCGHEHCYSTPGAWSALLCPETSEPILSWPSAHPALFPDMSPDTRLTINFHLPDGTETVRRRELAADGETVVLDGVDHVVLRTETHLVRLWPCGTTHVHVVTLSSARS